MPTPLELPVCPFGRCNGTGELSIPNPYFPGDPHPTVLTWCECSHRPRRLKIMRAAKVPELYVDSTREGWEAHFGQPWAEHPAFSRLADWPGKRFAAQDTWLVAIYGPNGTGKTSMASVLLLQALRAQKTALFVDATEWGDRMEAAMDDPGGAMREYMRVQDAPFLLLDDLAAVRGGRDQRKREQTAFYRERVAALLRYRERNLRWTVITCNLVEPGHDVPEAETWPAGMAVFDRSLVGRVNVPLAFGLTGPDRRQVGGAG